MFNWAKQQLANVAGTQEPIYGPSAIQSVAVEAAQTPYTEITSDDLKWQAQTSTNVETQTFYLQAKDGTYAMLQVIYSSVAGIRTTCQFNAKITFADASKPFVWCSTPLNNWDFNENKTAFFADDCAVELGPDGESWSIKSMNDERAIINITVHRVAPAFQAGKTGKTLFGTDLTKPWGSMRHAFWPRCRCEGTIVTKNGTAEFGDAAGMYVYALQGMKPHHLAARWNFFNLQCPSLSAVMMEFTTPPSYGSTTVNVSTIARDGEIVVANTNGTVVHTKSAVDPETEWPEPQALKLTWTGKTKDGQDVVAVVEGELGQRSDRVDVMSEVPGFVKQIVSTAAGTKPYIYMFNARKTLSVRLKIADQDEIVETGDAFFEATFISADE
jgi:hypothetical protein